MKGNGKGLNWAGPGAGLALLLVLTVGTRMRTDGPGGESRQWTPPVAAAAGATAMVMSPVHMHVLHAEHLAGMDEPASFPELTRPGFDSRGISGGIREMAGPSMPAMPGRDAVRRGLPDDGPSESDGGISWGWLADEVRAATPDGGGDRGRATMSPQDFRREWGGRSQTGNDELNRGFRPLLYESRF